MFQTTIDLRGSEVKKYKLDLQEYGEHEDLAYQPERRYSDLCRMLISQLVCFFSFVLFKALRSNVRFFPVDRRPGIFAFKTDCSEHGFR
jgi:hypothetical protein